MTERSESASKTKTNTGPAGPAGIQFTTSNYEKPNLKPEVEALKGSGSSECKNTLAGLVIKDNTETMTYDQGYADGFKKACGSKAGTEDM